MSVAETTPAGCPRPGRAFIATAPLALLTSHFGTLSPNAIGCFSLGGSDVRRDLTPAPAGQGGSRGCPRDLLQRAARKYLGKIGVCVCVRSQGEAAWLCSTSQQELLEARDGPNLEYLINTLLNKNKLTKSQFKIIII